MSDSSPPVRPTDLWDDYSPTPLLEMPALGRLTNVGRVFLKCENERPLGNFKVLGGMVAGLQALARTTGAPTLRALIATPAANGSLPALITASEGNHGLAVAAAAQRAGTKAVIYLPDSVNEMRARRIRAFGAEVVWVRGTYDSAVEAAAAAAAGGEGLLIPDTSTDPNDAVVRDVMAGYHVMIQELIAQFLGYLGGRPTHAFVQAGVGGLAAVVAAGLREFMEEPRQILVVEPESAACVARALQAGHPVRIPGDLHTSAEMLACGLASASAVEILRRHAARSVAVSELELQTAVASLKDAGGPSTTSSGATGLAGLLHVASRHELRLEHRLTEQSSVLLIVTEGPVPI